MRTAIAKRALLALLCLWGFAAVVWIASDPGAEGSDTEFIAQKTAAAAALVACLAAARMAQRRRWLPDTPEKNDKNQRKEDYYD